MCDDLQSAGIDTFMDITKGDSSTNFDASLLEWIKSSDFVLLVGSTSFATRSKDPSTLTFNKALETASSQSHLRESLPLHSLQDTKTPLEGSLFSQLST
jgi:hypothetical protein